MKKDIFIQKGKEHYQGNRAPALVEAQLGYLYDDLSSPQRDTDFEDALTRYYNDEPIQYISGIAHFYGFVFDVNPSVLIPRAETEELVYQVEQYIDASSQQLSVLDVGTGSGCIPICVKLKCEQSKVTAIDVSDEALTVAKSNAEKLKADIHFQSLDFTDKQLWTSLPKYDVLISNPPYIPYKEQSLMHSNVLDHEPHLALFVEDEDPLLFYRLVAEFGQDHLHKGGKVFLELNEYNANDVKLLYENFGYSSVEVVRDLQGKERMLTAFKND